MKSQTDLIVTIVAVLCMLIGVGVFFGTKKEATKQPPPEKVVSAPLQLPAANVVMAPALPGAGGGQGGAGFGGGGRGFGPMTGGGPAGRPGAMGAPMGATPPGAFSGGPPTTKVPGQLPQLSAGS